MPLLELPDLDAPAAGVYLLAVMLMPKKAADAHLRFVRAWRNAAVLELASRIDPSKASRATLLGIRDAAVGVRIREVIDEYRSDAFVRSRQAKGGIAAKLLIHVLSYADHEPGCPERGTLEYAYRQWAPFVGGGAHIKGVSRASLAQAWSGFSSVSHLWCAHNQLGPFKLGPVARGKELADLLGLAEAFRRKGESHKPRNSPPLLDPKKTWRPRPSLCLPVCDSPLPTPAAWRQEMTNLSKKT